MDESIALSRISAPQKNPLTAYPNPVKQGAVLKIQNEFITESAWEFIRMDGVCAGRVEPQNGQISIPSTLVPGTYLLRSLGEKAPAVKILVSE